MIVCFTVRRNSPTHCFMLAHLPTGFLFVIRHVGRLFVKGNGKPMDILTKLNEMAHFAPDEEIELFEVKPSFLVFILKFMPFQVYASKYPVYLTFGSMCRKLSLNLTSCVSRLTRS